jgi:isopentenyl diphosphate isomerase/L-lactate dehydrogenase-like FMN-dependent dehydrogenase
MSERPRWTGSFQIPDDFATLGEIYDAARTNLKAEVWEFVDAGAGEEWTAHENIRAFQDWCFRPRLLTGIAPPRSTQTFLGITLSAPILTAPFGGDAVIHEEGHLAVARADQRFGIASIVPGFSSFSLEQIAAEAPSAARFFQLHSMGSDQAFLELASRAAAAGYTALCVTADAPTRGWRDRLLRARLDLGTASSGNFERVLELDAPDVFGQFHGITEPIWSWSRLEAVVRKVDLPFMVKGIMTAEDAELAISIGAAAVYVSNHGGRQLDGAPASLRQLPEVVGTVAGRVPIVFDGGIRRGIDVVKAVSLGADVVVIGRAAAMGLAAAGEAGVFRVLELIREEMFRTMALVGRADIASLNPSLLQRASAATAVPI